MKTLTTQYGRRNHFNLSLRKGRVLSFSSFGMDESK